MIALDITVPQADIERMNDTFKRYVDYYKGNFPKAIEKTAVQILKSLAGSTTRANPFRKVVRNPNTKGLRLDTHAADIHAHIQQHYKWFPGTRHNAKRQGAMLRAGLPPINTLAFPFAIERFTRRKGLTYVPIKNRWLKGVNEARDYARTNMPRHYQIHTRGLAKSSWGWMLRGFGGGANVEQKQIPGTTEVSRYMGGNGETMGVNLADMLAYIRKATKSNISTVISRATSQMMYDMGEITRKAKQHAGLSA
jgi:hypothetical protein